MHFFTVPQLSRLHCTVLSRCTVATEHQKQHQFFCTKLCDWERQTRMDWQYSGGPWDEVKQQASEKNWHISTCQCWKWVRSVSITMLAIIMILISYFLHKHCAWVNLWCILCTFPGYSEHWQSLEHCKQFSFSSSSCTIFLQVTTHILALLSWVTKAGFLRWG